MTNQRSKRTFTQKAKTGRHTAANRESHHSTQNLLVNALKEKLLRRNISQSSIKKKGNTDSRMKNELHQHEGQEERENRTHFYQLYNHVIYLVNRNQQESLESARITGIKSAINESNQDSYLIPNHVDKN